MYPSHALELPSDLKRSAITARRKLEQFYERWLTARVHTLTEFEDPLSPIRKCARETPVLLLGASQGFAWDFIEKVAQKFLVVGVIDDYRVGEKHAGLPISAEGSVHELAKRHRNLLAVNLALGPSGIRYFDILAQKNGLTCLTLWQALRAFELHSVHFSGDDLGEETLRYLPSIIAETTHYADELSRYTAYQTLLYRITLDRSYTKSVCIGMENLIFCPSLLSFHPNEVFIDGGAFTGDTINAFHKVVGGWYKNIYAFEPDAANFVELQRSAGAKQATQLFRNGLGDRKRTMRFSSMASPGSHVSEHGEERIDVVALDDVGVESATFVKLNIEGAECMALDGARETISRARPKMAISVDHLGGDLHTISEKLRLLDAGYDIFVRHHTYEYFGAYLYARPRPH